MPRAYIPLKAVVHPPPIEFANGVQLVTHDAFQPSDLDGWERVFSLDELQEIREWHLAIACDWNSELDISGKTSPEVRLANAHLALQVAAPVGTYLSVCIREQDDEENPRLMTTRFERFHGTVWSRMKGFNGMTVGEPESVVNGVISILEKGDARTSNPIRLFEHGLISANPYIRILLWVTAIDGILMAVKESLFIRRLSALLGADSLVFPPEDGVFIKRPTVVGDIAGDLFGLRSELAHGQAISRRFWEVGKHLRDLLDPQAYGSAPQYLVLLEESALSLLTRILRKIILEDLVDDFSSAKKWRARLNNS